MWQDKLQFLAAALVLMSLATGSQAKVAQRSDAAPKIVEACQAGLFVPCPPPILPDMEPGGGSGTGG